MSEQVDDDDNTENEALIYYELGASAVGLVLLGTVVYWWLEDWSWVDSFYFSVIAITTVGFGDVTPSTDAAKLFTVGYIVVGISLVAAYLDARFKKHAGRRSRGRR